MITGATGFIGSALADRLRQDKGVAVIAAVRRLSERVPSGIRQIPVGDLGKDTHWGLADYEPGIVIHTAGRAHVLKETAENPIAAFRRVNVEGTISLARQARAAKVRRFIFISSIGVHGSETFDRPFAPIDRPDPQEDYALSKFEAEIELRECFRDSPTELVIIRPPLVYGPNAPGNFGRLVKLLQKRLPLPFGAIRNKRTLVGLGNLVDLIVTCVHHPAAANQIFLAGDSEDLSTTDLLVRLGDALGKPAFLLPVPASMLKVAAVLVGKSGISQRLCGSLQVDISKNREMLGWVPPYSVNEGLRATARASLNESTSH